MILIVCEPGDSHAAAVASRLVASGHAVEIVDGAELASGAAVEIEIGGDQPRFRRRLVVGERTIELDEVAIGWWRRRPDPVLPPALLLAGSAPDPASDATDPLESVLDSLDISWISDPRLGRRSRSRPLLWAAAAHAGFALPRTLVTRDREAARAFADDHADGIIATTLTRRADDWSDGTRMESGACLSAWFDGTAGDTVLQAWVVGVDVRVMIVGSAMFAVELVDRDPGMPLDLALELGAVRRVELSDAVFDSLAEMMATLGLSTATVDLRRTADGHHVVTDLDPSPRWAPFERQAGWPVTAAVADLLALRHRVLAGAR